MNKKTKIVILVVSVVVIALIVAIAVFVGINANKTNEGDGTQVSKETASSSKAKASISDCMKKIEITNSIDEINDIIGFDGELTNENEEYKYKTYTWEFSDDESISITQHEKYPNNTTVEARIPTKKITEKADFSKYDEIKDALDKSESLTYDEFVEKVGGVEGVLDKKTNSETRYQWADGDGGYLHAYFDEDNKCTMVTGRF